MIEKSIHFKTTKIRDSLIKILMLCNEFSVTDLVKDIEDMQCLIQTYNPLLGKVFEEMLVSFVDVNFNMKFQWISNRFFMDFDVLWTSKIEQTA